MAKQIGWGIIGYGVIGPHHGMAVMQAPGAKLLGVCDIDPSREQKLREQGYDAPFFTDYKEMLRRVPEIAAVSICTPSGIHYQSALHAARTGRHVLCEKPLDISLKNMDRMIEACETAGVKMGCIFQKRTSQTHILAKKALQKNLLGKLVLGDSVQKYYRSPAYYKSAGWRGTWKLDGGGALMNQGVHGIDLLLWLMGDVESVFTYSDHRVRDIEVEDTSVSVIRFKNGALGNITGTTSVVPGQGAKTMIHGEKGTIDVSDSQITCQVAKLVKGTHKAEAVDLAAKFKAKAVTAAKDEVSSDNTALSTDGHTIQVQDLCAAITKNRDPMIPGREARRAVELILAIYKSWKTGKEVKLPL